MQDSKSDTASIDEPATAVVAVAREANAAAVAVAAEGEGEATADAAVVPVTHAMSTGTNGGGYGSAAYYDGGDDAKAVAVNLPAPAVPYADVMAATATTAAAVTPTMASYGEQQGAQATQAEATRGGGYKGAHPIAALFHVLFKAAALLTFLLGGIVSSSYVLIFILTILFVAADFWVTKNVSGRLMVCLRWWNEVREDGATRWVFESSPNVDDCVNRYDRWFFWTTLTAYNVLWLLMTVFNLMSVTRLPIALVGFILAATNMLGYVKCQRDARGRVTQYMLSHAASANFGFGRS